MKTNTLILTSVLAAVALTGCYTPDGRPDNTATGALSGGAFGAATGAIIGSASHSAGGGALIGAAAGAILGGLLGHSEDQAQEARLRRMAPVTYYRVEQHQALTLSDVMALSKSGINDDTIIAQIRNTHSIFRLEATEIIALHDAAVSQKVIDFMINSPSTVTPATEIVVAGPPPAAQGDTRLYAPGPGYVWVEGQWVWRGGWVWEHGHWAAPPYAQAVWVPGYWEPGPRGWVMVGGYWR